MKLYQTLQICHSLFTILSQQFKLPFTFPVSTGAYKTAAPKTAFLKNRRLKSFCPSLIQGACSRHNPPRVNLQNHKNIMFASQLLTSPLLSIKIQHLGIIHSNHKPFAWYCHLPFSLLKKYSSVILKLFRQQIKAVNFYDPNVQQCLRIKRNADATTVHIVCNTCLRKASQALHHATISSFKKRLFSITIASLADVYVLNQSATDWQDEGLVNFPVRTATDLWKGRVALSSVHAVVKASLSSAYFTVTPCWQPHMYSTILSCQPILLLQSQKSFCTDWHFPSKLLKLSLSCLPPRFLLSAD